MNELPTKSNHSISIGVKELEGRLVQGVRYAEEPFERVKLVE